MLENQNIKEYLKKNLRLRMNGGKVELLLEGEIISCCDVGEPSQVRERLTCDSCGNTQEADFFCALCSEDERPVCYQCCSCM